MKTHKTTRQRNQHIIPLEDGTALLVFAAHCGNRDRIPQINRFYRAQGAFCPMDHGRVLTAGGQRACCLVIRTGPGDILAIAEPRHHKQGLDWVFFAVGEDFSLTVIEDGRKMDYTEIHQILLDSKTQMTGPLKVTDGDLRRLFQGSVPSWLDSILEAQLDDWRERDPAAFANYTPKAPNLRDLGRCITAAPCIMLERWKGLLNDHQMARCIRLSPEGAVRYALERIPAELREEYLIQHATTALEYCKSELSGSDWAACASVLPKETYKLRMSQPSRDQAYILGTVFEMLWILPFANPGAGERSEILESIREHPDVWLSLHQSDFGLLFDRLERFAKIQPSQSLLHSLMNHEDEEVRRKVFEYVPALI